MKTIIALLVLCIACSTTKDKGQTTVESVDLKRFAGNWFEIARYETPLQTDCGSAKITIKLIKKKVDMYHACHDKITGDTIHAHGIAEVEDKKTNAKLKASYMPIFQKWGMFGGSIWIIALDPEYHYAILGHPTHKHFWIISRTPGIPPEKYEELVAMAKAQGYKPKEIQRVPMWK
jgi:apolipoprotein D and lipocalin family protein